MEGPSAEQIAEWKTQYGAVYSASSHGVEYIFRALIYKEYDGIPEDWSSAEIEDYAVSRGVLWPPSSELDRLPAGFVTQLAEKILDVSGLGDPSIAKGILEEKRDRAEEVRGLMKAFVLATMPSYKEEDLDLFNFNQLAAKVALAEQIIKVKQAMLPLAAGESTVSLELIDPNEIEQGQQEATHKKAVQRREGQALPHDPIAQKLHQALGG